MTRMRHFPWNGAAALAVMGAALLGLGCGGGAYRAASEGVHPLGPASIRISPLTRLGTHQSGVPLLILHMEVRDAWGDTIKSLGRLRVMVTEPQGVADTRTTLRQVSWEHDLESLDEQPRRWDRATRTYRIQLRDVPEWLIHLAKAENRSSRPATLTAVWTIRTASAGEVTFKDEIEFVP